MTMPTGSPVSVLRSAQIRALEQTNASARPSLMERAGLAAALVAERLLGNANGTVLVLAGPGNNGGDGFVVARELRNRGHDVTLACLSGAGAGPSDAAEARQRWLDCGGQIVSDFVGGQWGLVVDALFGIGLSRAPVGHYANWIHRVNGMTCPVLALDIPSGLDADTGVVLSEAIRATHTASFIALKPGMLTLDGPDHCGDISVHELDLDVPLSDGQLIEPACFAEFLRPRLRNVHKGHFGSLGVIGGAPGMLGAAMLASRAGLKTGAGKVFMGALDSHAPPVDSVQPEIMMRNPGDVYLLADVLAIGPGLGMGESASLHMRRALGFGGPLLIDADGLNVIAESVALQEILAQRESATILTPHPGEAARLLRTSLTELQSDRVSRALELAERFRAIVLLKGCGTVIADAEQHWYINATGNGGMASAGMGDVLTGILGALLAQRWPALAATQAAAHLHGAAADQLVREGRGPAGLAAGETIDAARSVLNRWLQNGR